MTDPAASTQNVISKGGMDRSSTATAPAISILAGQLPERRCCNHVWQGMDVFLEERALQYKGSFQLAFFLQHPPAVPACSQAGEDETAM
jgi:hypothetical protein